MSAHSPVADDREPITHLELIALQRLYLDARYREDHSAAASIQNLFQARAKEFAVGRSLADIMGPVDEDGETYDTYLGTHDDPPPAPPSECFESRLSAAERARWLRAHAQDDADWTDDEILLAMGSGFN
ncbi:hypothetical protein [Demequina sp. NBRC 110056]|uniref:hypothetical protein n=1 Tax=Demequina sp. NBRC 110056 TaxID=1570345 RepID=UPI0009FD554B|nr:hypothetical protein [Demequina sp. NBRC 110056]